MNCPYEGVGPRTCGRRGLGRKLSGGLGMAEPRTIRMKAGLRRLADEGRALLLTTTAQLSPAIHSRHTWRALTVGTTEHVTGPRAPIPSRGTRTTLLTTLHAGRGTYGRPDRAPSRDPEHQYHYGVLEPLSLGTTTGVASTIPSATHRASYVLTGLRAQIITRDPAQGATLRARRGALPWAAGRVPYGRGPGAQ